jgi:hypothetical protein
MREILEINEIDFPFILFILLAFLLLILVTG